MKKTRVNEREVMQKKRRNSYKERNDRAGRGDYLILLKVRETMHFLTLEGGITR